MGQGSGGKEAVKICKRFFLTLAAPCPITLSDPVRQEFADRRLVGRRDRLVASKRPLAIASLVRHQMAAARRRADDFPCSRDPKALRGAPVCFQFCACHHVSFVVSLAGPAVGAGAAAAVVAAGGVELFAGLAAAAFLGFAGVLRLTAACAFGDTMIIIFRPSVRAG